MKRHRRVGEEFSERRHRARAIIYGRLIVFVYINSARSIRRSRFPGDIVGSSVAALRFASRRFVGGTMTAPIAVLCVH